MKYTSEADRIFTEGAQMEVERLLLRKLLEKHPVITRETVIKELFELQQKWNSTYVIQRRRKGD